MTRRFIDLSVPIKNNSQEPVPPVIEYRDHAMGAINFGKRYNIKPEDFKNGQYCAVEQINLNSHSGTHVDAPWHYGPLSGGEKARTIDEMPLDWFFHDGVTLDFSDRGAGDRIEAEDIEEALKNIGYTLKAMDIVLIRTDNLRKNINKPNNWELQPGMTRGSTLWLIEHGIKVMGIDAYSWDRPSKFMRQEMEQGIEFFQAHNVGHEIEYCHIEKLYNLESLPPFGFTVAVFPIKIEKGSAGWVRPVAIIDD